MPLYSSNFEGTMPFVANTGGVVIGTLVKMANLVTYLAVAPAPGATTTMSGSTLTVTSGHSVIGLVEGLIPTVNKISGTAWTAGQPLAYDGTAFTTVVSATRVVANAYGPATSAAVTGDVLLCLPNALGPA